MKILFTGGGSGGHFYPIIAVAEEINRIAKEERLIAPQLFFMSDSPYDSGALIENSVEFVKSGAGKMRKYFSLLNLFDVAKTFIGVISALLKVYRIYPDVVFSKGAYASFPVLVAAKILRIPVIIHESDSAPGRVNKWAGKFAERIAVSYPEAARFFDSKKIAVTGNPIRKEIMKPVTNGAYEFLKLENDLPVILVIGGSLGSQIINDAIVDALPTLVENYQIIHQTGKNNIKEILKMADMVLAGNSKKGGYRPFDYLNNLAMSMSAGIAQLVISRAGSAIFEIAAWGLPSIIIPITNSVSDHQRNNAYGYARSGAAIVIEESNLNAHILVSEINRIMKNKNELERMRRSAKEFAKIDAAGKIAREIIRIALGHER
ncbi:MAG: UDP-N-acetylglucosamine--N-acetylmuramyl-(pentapeptide) pyrophosphoryl-undecaprenol N-acetylglucosamine transferase [Patescibacteria group bacterium]|nr:UDP-N-acetylglucosamine--N-acetylmuramyl-(pentapeptide) pyrophosphoryl-undecaprenol N-acetylglucosamine transferase [Patescibacteria group bacterium]MDE1988343.1 UDP-N-acetylglucosamine--N-acetylmuramyl-(pentapeptide) pyrophosphoryl-undecaprenol N-acetylglucosamine transferase [Patescibacteria group bacterium]MDE2218160.1 UDP-N-acetylglucosamine--N-acetylmuramyl-(pentapeptide) pyrophosphoryl-undecaprenol N-acetylglucosamine transferase [Patescibacteria group bacterium]